MMVGLPIHIRVTLSQWMINVFSFLLIDSIRHISCALTWKCLPTGSNKNARLHSRNSAICLCFYKLLCMIIKTTDWGFILFTQNPWRNHQAETPSPKDEGLLPWWFLMGFELNRIPNECGFYVYPVISLIYIFTGTYTTIYLYTCAM